MRSKPFHQVLANEFQNLRQQLRNQVDAEALARSVDGTFMSAFIRATKRAPSACCGSDCCN